VPRCAAAARAGASAPRAAAARQAARPARGPHTPAGPQRQAAATAAALPSRATARQCTDNSAAESIPEPLTRPIGGGPRRSRVTACPFPPPARPPRLRGLNRSARPPPRAPRWAPLLQPAAIPLPNPRPHCLCCPPKSKQNARLPGQPAARRGNARCHALGRGRRGPGAARRRGRRGRRRAPPQPLIYPLPCTYRPAEHHPTPPGAARPPARPPPAPAGAAQAPRPLWRGRHSPTLAAAALARGPPRRFPASAVLVLTPSAPPAGPPAAHDCCFLSVTVALATTAVVEGGRGGVLWQHRHAARGASPLGVEPTAPGGGSPVRREGAAAPAPRTAWAPALPLWRFWWWCGFRGGRKALRAIQPGDTPAPGRVAFIKT
jgi:hypothetical protein